MVLKGRSRRSQTGRGETHDPFVDEGKAVGEIGICVAVSGEPPPEGNLLADALKKEGCLARQDVFVNFVPRIPVNLFVDQAARFLFYYTCPNIIILVEECITQYGI